MDDHRDNARVNNTEATGLVNDVLSSMRVRGESKEKENCNQWNLHRRYSFREGHEVPTSVAIPVPSSSGRPVLGIVGGQRVQGTVPGSGCQEDGPEPKRNQQSAACPGSARWPKEAAAESLWPLSA